MCGGCAEETHPGSVCSWANTSRVRRRRRAEPPSAALSPSCRQSHRRRRPPATWAMHLRSLGSSAGTTEALWGFRNTAAARGEEPVSVGHLLDEREEDLGHGAEIVLLAGVQHVTGAAQRRYFVHQVVLATLLQHHLQHLADAGLPLARLLQLGAAQRGERDRVQPVPTLLELRGLVAVKNSSIFICHVTLHGSKTCVEWQNAMWFLAHKK